MTPTGQSRGGEGIWAKGVCLTCSTWACFLLKPSLPPFICSTHPTPQNKESFLIASSLQKAVCSDLRSHLCTGRVCEIPDSDAPCQDVRPDDWSQGCLKRAVGASDVRGISKHLHARSWLLFLVLGAGTSLSPDRTALCVSLFKSWMLLEPRGTFWCEPECKRIEDSFTSYSWHWGRKGSPLLPQARKGWAPGFSHPRAHQRGA